CTAARGEIEESLELTTDPRDVRLEGLAVQEVPLRGRPGRVPYHPGRPAHQDDRPAAATLEVEEPEHRHEAADVERRPRRVEAVVAGDRPSAREAARQAGRRGFEQAPPVELGE